MLSTTPSLRYERKYQINHLPLAVVREIIRAHPASFRPLFPDRTIHNIYFDTPGLSTHTHNLLGAGERRKFRVRWYGDDPARVVRPQLEVKRRLHFLGDKLTYPVADWEWQMLSTLTQQVQDHVVDAPALRPQLYNRYRRSYLGTADGRFRITIDRELRYLPFARINSARLPTCLANVPFASSVLIVELKYAAADDEYVGRIVGHLPFKLTKKSKYATGMLVAR